jgi:outer membrane protein assembly factor BamB
MHKALYSRGCICVALLLIITLLTACQGQMHLGLIWPETGTALIPEFARGADGTLYFMDEAGTLHAVTAQGQERWTYRGDSVSALALVVSRDGASIYLTTTDGSIYLRLRSGGPPAVASSTQVITDSNGQTVVKESDVAVFGANGHRVSPDGTGLPSQWPEFAYGRIAFDSQGRVYLRDSVAHQILSLAANGADYWQCAVQGYLSAGPVMSHKDVLLYLLDDGTFVAQTTTCQELWRYSLGANGKQRVNYSITVGPDDTVCVGGPAGQVTALSADSGQLRWQSQPNPSVGDVVHVIASEDGRGYAGTSLADVLGFEHGNLVWSQVLSEPGQPGPLQTTREGGLALVQDGRLLVYTRDAALARPTHARSSTHRYRAGRARDRRFHAGLYRSEGTRRHGRLQL